MKTKRLLFKTISLFLGMTILVACSEKGDDEFGSDPVVPVGTKSLQVTPSKLTFTAAGGTQTLQVKTTYPKYGYYFTADWISAGFKDDPTYNYITITANPNTNPEARSTTVRVDGADENGITIESVNITVEQEGNSSGGGSKTYIVPVKGGTIEEGDISITFPEGTFSSDTKLELAEAKADEIVGKEAQKSTFYTITIAGPTEKDFTLSLKGKDTDGQTRAIRRSDGVNLHTGATLEYTLPVDAKVKDGVYTVTIPKIESEPGDKPRFTMGLATVASSETSSTRGDSPGADVSWAWKWLLNSTDKEIIRRTEEYAEEAFKVLAALGFEKPGRKVPYVIQKVDKAWGNHIQARSFNSDNYIELNEDKFKNLLSASAADLQELRRTLIHETSHYYHQQIYDTRPAPVKTAKGLMGDEWTMLTESIGGWSEKQTEPYEMDLNVVTEQASFIKHFIPYKFDMTVSIGHGYSMGIAIEWLAKHTKDKNIVKMLQYQRDKKATTLRGCYDLFLKEHSMKLFDYASYGKFLDELFKGEIDKRIDITTLSNPVSGSNVVGLYELPRQLNETIYDWGASVNQFKIKTSDLATVNNRMITIKEASSGVRTEVYVADITKLKDLRYIGTAVGNDSVVISDLKQFDNNTNMRVFLVSLKAYDDGSTFSSNTTIQMIEKKAPEIIGKWELTVQHESYARYTRNYSWSFNSEGSYSYAERIDAWANSSKTEWDLGWYTRIENGSYTVSGNTIHLSPTKNTLWEENDWDNRNPKTGSVEKYSLNFTLSSDGKKLTIDDKTFERE